MSEEEKTPATGGPKRIAVIGDWHLAFVTAASLAQQGHDVLHVHRRAKKDGPRPKLEIHEPHLDEIIDRAVHAGRLTFTDELLSARACDVVWLAIDTPLTPDDAPDVGPLLAVIERIAQGSFELLVIGSQVPIGFCQRVEKLVTPAVAHVPENLQLGKAMQGFHEPDRLVIGAANEDVRQRVADILMFSVPPTELPSDYVAALASWKRRKRERILTCDLPTAEMIKHATNAFLATSISFANEMAKVGEAFGADNQLVAKALKMDSRIGPKAYVRPGLGFAGGTLPRDLHAMRAAMLARSITMSPTPVIDAVLKTNDDVIEHIAETIVELPLPQKFVVLMGYTYKADSDTLRGSPSLAISRTLHAMGLWQKYDSFDPSDMHIYGYDPRMKWEEVDPRREQAGVQRHLAAWKSAHGSNTHAVYVIVTPLAEFKTLPWSGMGPGVVFDLCDGADKKAVLAAGLSYKAIWQPIEQG